MARNRGPIETVWTEFRMLRVDREFYEKLARTRGTTLSETLRDALTAYRALMQLPLVATVRPLSELRGELVQAYREQAVADIPNAGSDQPRKRARKS